MTISIKNNNYEAQIVECLRDAYCDCRDSIVITVNGITYEEASGKIILPYEYSEYTIRGAIVIFSHGMVEIHIGKKEDAEILEECESMIADLAGMLTDEQALTVISVYSEWNKDVVYEVGQRVRDNGRLYKRKLPQDAPEIYAPHESLTAWECISESSGSDDDIIDYAVGMELIKDKFYKENDIVYVCIRDSGVPLYNNLSDLINIYVQVANDAT